MSKHCAATTAYRAATALVGASLPVIVSWVLLATLMIAREEPPPVGSPNPAKAPVWMLGPGGLLVYGDRWFAGTAYLWYFVATVALLGLIAWSAITAAESKPRQAAPRRGVWRLWIVSVMVGFVLAAPWYYALLARITS